MSRIKQNTEDIRNRESIVALASKKLAQGGDAEDALEHAYWLLGAKAKATIVRNDARFPGYRNELLEEIKKVAARKARAGRELRQMSRRLDAR